MTSYRHGHLSYLQMMFRYADPIFVSAESIQCYIGEGRLSPGATERLFRSTWWNTLLTTRVLLAHAGANESGELFMSTVVQNIKCLLLLVGVDITMKDAFSTFAAGATAWMRTDIAFGRDRCIRMRDVTCDGDILTALDPVRYCDVRASFDESLEDEELRSLCNLFGRAVYHLVATRDGAWMLAAKRFSDAS